MRNESFKKAVLTGCFFLLYLLFSIAGYVYADEAGNILDSCETLIQSGRFDDARLELTKYRRSHPDDPRGLFVLARLEENADKALALLKEVELLAMTVTDVPDSTLAAESLFERGSILYMSGRTAEAVNLFQRLVTGFQSSPRFYDAVYRLAVINLTDGKTKNALEKFRTCLAGSPSDEIRLLASTGKMECHVVLKEWTEALVSAREALDQELEDVIVTPRVLTVLDRAWTELGNDENAAFYRDQLLSKYPDSFEAHAIREKGDRLAFENSVTDSGEMSGNLAANKDVIADAENSVREGKNSAPSDDESVGGRFSVQAGSFTDRMNAFRMYEKLKMRGLDSRVELKDVGGRHNYQVLVGRFTSRSEALIAKRKVDGINDGGSFVVGISSK